MLESILEMGKNWKFSAARGGRVLSGKERSGGGRMETDHILRLVLQTGRNRQQISFLALVPRVIYTGLVYTRIPDCGWDEAFEYPVYKKSGISEYQTVSCFYAGPKFSVRYACEFRCNRVKTN